MPQTLGQAAIEIVADSSQFDQEVADTGKTLSTKLTGSAVKDLGKVETALSEVKGEMGKVQSEASTTGDALGTDLGGKADTAERSVMGLRDMIDGTAAIMQGPGKAGLSAYLQGWADLAGGAANFAIPAFEAVKAGFLGQIKQAAASTAKVVLQIGRQIAAWALMGVQSLIHAAKVAAAWLIAMGPIALVVAAVVGLVALIVLNWDKIKKAIAAAWEAIKKGVTAAWDWIKKAVKTAIDAVVTFFKNWTLIGILIEKWDKIKEVFGNAVQFIKDIWTGLIEWFKGLPEKIGNAVSGMWDGITTAFKGAINWIISRWNDLEISLGGGTILGVDIPKITIRTPNIPLFQEGGIFTAPGGGAGLAILHHGEAVIPANVTRQMMRGGGFGDVNVIINITGSISDAQAKHTGRVAAEAAIDRLSREAVLQ